MYKILIGCGLVLVLSACAMNTTGQSVTTTHTVVQNTGLIPRARDTLRTQFATTPYAGPVDDICASAAAALVRDRDLGGAGPVDNLLWNGDSRVGPDCASAFLTAGFTLPTGVTGEASRRISAPGVLPDGRLLISVDYGCENQWCLGGASYFVSKDDDHWIVGPDPLTWIH